MASGAGEEGDGGSVGGVWQRTRGGGKSSGQWVSVRLICERERLGCVQPREGKIDRGEEKENGEVRERPVESSGSSCGLSFLCQGWGAPAGRR